MNKNRMEAFSDGVLAVIITIMVLELKVPHNEDIRVLLDLWPVALSYILSFLYVGIYWNNHHHMLQAVRKVNGHILWSNLHLLFWLSLLPFCTGWVGENHFAKWPTVIYGFNLLCCALSYTYLQSCLIRYNDQDMLLAKAIGHDMKGKVSPVLYSLGIVAAWLDQPIIGMTLFIVVALMWLVPDKRVERMIAK